MAYTQSAGVSGLNELMDIIKTSVTSKGWTHFAMNTSSLAPNMDRIARQDVYRINGTSIDPTKSYVTLWRFVQENAFHASLGMTCFSGCKGFDTPITISSISRSVSFGTTVAVTCSIPHGLSTKDHVMINGTPLSGAFHEGWAGTGDLPTGGGFNIIVSSTSSFHYASVDANSDNFGGPVSGGYTLAVYNPTGPYSTNISTPHTIQTSNPEGPFSVAMYYDEYRVAGVLMQGGNFKPFYFGETARNHIPSDFSSRAFLNAVATTGITTASLDRNVNNIHVGQKIWFINPSGSAGTGSFERVTVTSRPTSSSFGCVLSGTYPSGTLVGEDPMPLLVCGKQVNNNTTYNLSAADTIWTFHVDATRNTFGYVGNVQNATPSVDTGINYTSINPDSVNYYQGRDIYLERSTTPTGIRGRMVGFLAFPLGYQNDQDLMRVGSDPVEDDYKVFTSTLAEANFALGIGPGAS